MQLTLDESGTVAAGGDRSDQPGADADPRIRGRGGAGRDHLPDDATLAEAAKLAAAAAEPVEDSRGPADYKRSVARALTLRALKQALDRASA